MTEDHEVQAEVQAEVQIVSEATSEKNRKLMRLQLELIDLAQSKGKAHQVVLDLVYGNPSTWNEIADRNGLKLQ